MNEKIAALYLRLSDEDDDETLDESNSISSQRDILSSYIRTHDDLKEYRLVEFCDDGFSGTNFNRPEVQKLLRQIRQGVISCVLVKDFSRFGRNYIEVGNYLEQVFPFLGIRFISVNDCFDSSISACSGEFIDVAFKNLIYDLYSKDLSEKITTVRKSKAEQGKFITAYAPYGFLKSPDQRLVADEETAPIVRRIFQMAADEVPKLHIAQTLNAEGILTPLMLRKQRGQHFPCKQTNEKTVWRTSVISAILKDQRYTGDAVYGKVKPTAVGSGKDRPVSRDQWIIVPDCHEQIVSRDLFETVNSMFTKRAKYSKEKVAPLAGMVRCMTCNHVISRKKRVRAKIGETAVYRCSTPTFGSEFNCYTGTIEEREIEEAILLLLQKASSALMNLEVIETVQASQTEKIEQVEKFLIKYASEMQKLNCLRMVQYESYKDGKLTKDEFIKEKSQIEGQVEKLLNECELKQQELYVLRCTSESEPDSASMLKQFSPFETLTREMMESFVQQIYICQDGTLRIEWKFDDFFQLLK